MRRRTCNADRVSREAAKARSKGRRRFSVSSLAQVVQLPKTFCGHEGVMECSGLTELWMARERVDGKMQSGVKPPQSKKPGSLLNFLKSSPWRLRVRFLLLRPDDRLHLQISNFRFPHSPSPPSHRLSTPVSRPHSPIPSFL
jgi:hypothetical protein